MAKTVRELITELQTLSNLDAPVFIAYENPYGVEDMVASVEIVEVQGSRVVVKSF